MEATTIAVALSQDVYVIHKTLHGIHTKQGKNFSLVHSSELSPKVKKYNELNISLLVYRLSFIVSAPTFISYNRDKKSVIILKTLNVAVQ